jgi:diacylglycerol kinase family enzyme
MGQLRGATASASDVSPTGPVERDGALPAILLNANAKLVGPSLRRRLVRLVGEENVYWCETLEQTRAHMLAVLEKRHPRLLVGGGDGTFAHAVTQLDLAAREVAASGEEPAWPAIGVLRLGTGNALGHLARAGRIDLDVLRHVEQRHPFAARLPLIRDAATGLLFPFASLGYDAGVLNDYANATGSWTHPWARRVGRSMAGYAWTLATQTLPRELGAGPVDVRVRAVGAAARIGDDDEEEPVPNDTVLFDGPARSVVGGTSPFYGYGIRALPFAQRRPDRLHLRISTATVTFLLGHLPQLWSGELRTPDFHDFLVEGVRVEAQAPIPLQWAGEAGGTHTELEWRLSGRSVDLLRGSA